MRPSPGATSSWCSASEASHRIRRARPRRSLARTRALADLQEQLAASKAYVSSVIEQYALTTQALAQSSEEMQATNEELQSANEELETAKEELQSTNEELTTVNDELQARYQEVNDLSNDLQNLVTSADIPIVIVDLERNVRRFTPRARSSFNLLPADLGRAIAEIRPNVDAPELDAWISEVIETAVREVEVPDRDGRWQRLQIRPYQTADKRIDGAVVSLVDIDALKSALTEVGRARDFAAATLETVPLPVVVLDEALRARRRTTRSTRRSGRRPRRRWGGRSSSSTRVRAGTRISADGSATRWSGGFRSRTSSSSATCPRTVTAPW